MSRSNVMWFVYFTSLVLVLISYFVLDRFNGIAFAFALIALGAFTNALYFEHVEKQKYMNEGFRR